MDLERSQLSPESDVVSPERRESMLEEAKTFWRYQTPPPTIPDDMKDLLDLL